MTFIDIEPENQSGRILKLAGIIVAALVVMFAVFVGIHSRIQATSDLKHKTEEAAVPSAEVTHPVPGSASGEISLPGNTVAFTDTPIYARTSGYLKAWYADIGAHVKQGQLLAVIETPELDQQLQQAQANLKESQAAFWLARVNYNRDQNLLKKQVISQEDFDSRTGDLQTKQATVDANAAAVRRLEKLQSFENVFAPFDGVITARNTDIGNLIQSGANTLPNELFHLAAIDRLRIYVSVPEVDASVVKDGEPVSLTFDSAPGQTFKGTVVRNSDSIDAVTRTLKVEVDVANQDGRLFPGAYAFVHFDIPATKGSVTIPSNTLLFRSEGLCVGIVRDGRIKLEPVTIGHDYGNKVEIIAGLTSKDPVVVNPSDSLENGAEANIATPGGRAHEGPDSEERSDSTYRQTERV